MFSGNSKGCDLPPSVARKLWELVDSNHENEVNVNKIGTAIKFLAPPRTQEPSKALFDLIDEGNRGFLLKEELTNYLKMKHSSSQKGKY
jgi:Ca2+-binding EF-hand superfamily protein